MKYVFVLALLCLSGCVVQSDFIKRKVSLKQDIEILKLEVRKEHLENELEALEKE